MKYSASNIGKLIRDTRKALGMTQEELALTSNAGQRFISELESGKETCQLEKALTVLQTLGIKISLSSPVDLESISGVRRGSGSGSGNSDGSGEG